MAKNKLKKFAQMNEFPHVKQPSLGALEKGYLMKDRLLRPSLVAVSKKPEKNEEKSEEKAKK